MPKVIVRSSLSAGATTELMPNYVLLAKCYEEAQTVQELGHEIRLDELKTALAKPATSANDNSLADAHLKENA